MDHFPILRIFRHHMAGDCHLFFFFALKQAGG
jgi:hypothetical protein